LELRRTIVVAEKPAQALPPPNASAGVLVFNTIDQFVAEALMVAFAMIVDHKLRERTTEVSLTQRNLVSGKLPRQKHESATRR
jgi:hypothetical protein